MQTLTQLFAHAARWSRKTALVHDGMALSYADLVRRIVATRQFLQTQNLPAAGVAVIASAHLLDDWVLLFALRSLGLCTTAARSTAEIQALGLADMTIVVGAPGDARDPPVLSAVDAALLAARWRCVQVPRAVLDAAPGAAPAPPAEPPAFTVTPAPSAGHIVRTSGTTGVQKMVLRDVATEARCSAALEQGYGYTAESVVYVADFPVWTAGGYRWPLCVWSVGGTVVLQSSPDLMRPLAERAISHAMLSPDKLMQLLAAPPPALDAVPRRNPPLQLMVTAGSLSRALLAQAQRQLGAQVYSALSSSEASLLACTLLHTDDDLRWHRLLPTRQVEVVDDNDQPQPSGTAGRVRVRINDGLAGYFGDAAATRAHFRDGYFYPGDLAVFGPDGRLALLGRSEEVVNVLGNKVATAHAEQNLRDRLQASAVCLLDLQGSGLDEELHVVIETAHRPAPDAVIAAIQAEFGAECPVPVRVHFADRMLRNATGKVLRVALRQQVLQTMLARRDGRMKG